MAKNMEDDEREKWLGLDEWTCEGSAVPNV